MRQEYQRFFSTIFEIKSECLDIKGSSLRLGEVAIRRAGGKNAPVNCRGGKDTRD
jgi:hypothetical protein